MAQSSSSFSLYSILCLVYRFPEKYSVECTLLTNSNIADEAGAWTPGYLQQNLLSMIYMISFHITYCTEKSPIQVYISPSQFSTINENDYGNRNMKRTNMCIICTCSGSCTKRITETLHSNASDCLSAHPFVTHCKFSYHFQVFSQLHKLKSVSQERPCTDRQTDRQTNKHSGPITHHFCK
jgi:hypothetical protein